LGNTERNKHREKRAVDGVPTDNVGRGGAQGSCFSGQEAGTCEGFVYCRVRISPDRSQPTIKMRANLEKARLAFREGGGAGRYLIKERGARGGVNVRDEGTSTRRQQQGEVATK